MINLSSNQDRNFFQNVCVRASIYISIYISYLKLIKTSVFSHKHINKKTKTKKRQQHHTFLYITCAWFTNRSTQRLNKMKSRYNTQHQAESKKKENKTTETKNNNNDDDEKKERTVSLNMRFRSNRCFYLRWRFKHRVSKAFVNIAIYT